LYISHRTLGLVCSLVASLAAGTRTASAQDLVNVTPGQTIRWMATGDSEFWYGRVVEVTDSLWRIRPRYTSQDVSLDRRTIRQVQLRRAARGRSVAVDAGVGAIGGATVGLVVGRNEGFGCADVCSGPSAPAVIAIGTASLGAIVGATIGYLVPFHVWRDVKE
jgi:hypothetical protein